VERNIDLEAVSPNIYLKSNFNVCLRSLRVKSELEFGVAEMIIR
jgi:hypothetical protein